MGEVYRAKDTRLERTVAIKILPIHLAVDAEFRERFEREAKLLSHLNHPRVCTLYDVGHEGDLAFLVMEYLEGETLAARLARESPRRTAGLPLNESIQIAIEIASALDAAHRLHITHRDLKPGNVILTKTGAKLLDFGLARANAGSIANPDHSSEPTQSVPAAAYGGPLTARGTILGTVQYMAPEQIEGKVTDARTDLFAFGALVYEMITGRKAFQGQSPGSLIGSILRDDPPPISSIQRLSPPAVDFVVTKCLAKDPDDRWQSARDVMSQLEWIAHQSVSQLSEFPSTGPILAMRRRERAAWTIAGALAVLTTIAIGRTAYVVPTAQEHDIRFEIPTPSGSQFDVTISPNGRLIAYVAKAGDGNSDVLWLRPLAATTAQPLVGTEGASAPFWSPDSRSIAFAAAGRLKRIDVAGGLPRTICDLSTVEGLSGTWNKDDAIVFASGTELLRVGARGGQPTRLTTLDKAHDETAHRYPSFLPDGRRFIFTIQSTDPTRAGIYARSLDSGDQVRVLPASGSADSIGWGGSYGVSMTAYAAPGYLIYESDRALMAQHFDASRLRTTGTAIRIAESLIADVYKGRAAFAVSSNGVLLYRAGGLGVIRQLQWFDRDGTPREKVGPPGLYRSLSLSPDEKRLALTHTDSEKGRTDIWTIELATGVPRPLTFDSANDDDPTWTPKEMAVTFWSDRGGKYGIYQRTLGSATDVSLLDSTAPTYLGDWCRDGSYLLYHDGHGIFALPRMNPRGTIRLVEPTSSLRDEPHFAPDGQWIAYSSNETGVDEVFAASFPASDKRRRVSLGGGGVPWWRADGRELFYMSRDGKLMSVPVDPGSAPDKFGSPVALFPMPIQPSMLNAQYVVTGNGQRILVAVPEKTTSTPLTVVLDWTRLLSQ